MHSLSFNVTTDFNAVVKRRFPSRLNRGFNGDLDKKAWLNCRNNSNSFRTFVIVACAAERNSSGGESQSSSSDSGTAHSSIPGSGSSPNSLLSGTQTYALLKQQMEVAAKSEVS